MVVVGRPYVFQSRKIGYVHYTCRDKQLTNTTVSFLASDETCDTVSDGGVFSSHLRLGTDCFNDMYSSRPHWIECSEADGQDNYNGGDWYNKVFGCCSEVTLPTTSGINTMTFPEVTMSSTKLYAIQAYGCYTFETTVTVPTVSPVSREPTSESFIEDNACKTVNIERIATVVYEIRLTTLLLWSVRTSRKSSVP